MKHAAKCKFCQRNLVIDVDDDYASLGDPYKLLWRAACNKCADLRVRRRLIEETICSVCTVIQFGGTAVGEKLRPVLEKLTRKYSVLVADWHNMSGYLWDPEFVNLLVEKPESIWTILNGYWRTFKETQKIKSTA